MSFSTVVVPANISVIPVDTRVVRKVLYLPTVSTNAGRFLLFKDYYGTATNSTFTISTTGTDLIDDFNFLYTMSNAWGSLSLVADGLRSWRMMNLYNGGLTPAAVGGFSPLQFSGLLVWTDASTLNVPNNTTLSTWTNGGSQGTVNCTGTYLTNQLNGRGIVRLNTSQTWTIVSQPNPSAYSMFFVSRQRGGTNRRVLQGNTGNYLYGYWNGYKNVLYVENNPGPYNVGPPSDSAWDFYSHTRTQNSAYIWNYNGTTSYSGSTSLNGPLGGLAINTSGGCCGGESSDCDLAEIILYDSQLTTLQVQQMEGYLAWKWGLQGNLPASHPYKNAPP
jgi:hypothetical protein